MKRLICLIIFSVLSYDSFADNSEAHEMWSDGGICAYDNMIIGITSNGDIWANKRKIEAEEMPGAIAEAKRSKNVVCIYVLADLPWTEDSPVVKNVLNIAKQNHDKYVYFISESESE